MTPSEDQSKAVTRLVWLDLARSFALLCMVIFHFKRDLEIFGLVPPGTTLTGGWSVFGQMIAGSFIFLSGLSFVLAHGGRFKPVKWARRVGIIAAAALLVTAATYFTFSTRYIYFGILHLIAAASVFGVVFLRLPAWALATAALAVLLVDGVWGRSLFSDAWLAWTGLSATVRPSLDLLPVVPWFAAFLAGMASAKALEIRNRRQIAASALTQRLAWPGRHSLAVYLVHQPILIGLAWAASRILQ